MTEQPNIKYAYVGDPTDVPAKDKLKRALKIIGAELKESQWIPDVNMYELKVGQQTLTLFVDDCSMDVEGPAELVDRLVSKIADLP